MGILLYGNKILREPISEIEIFDKYIHKEIQIAGEYLSKRKDALAIAANQLGFQHRFFIYKDHKTLKNSVILNPIILEHFMPYTELEGCLSFPNIAARVRRYKNIHVRFLSFPEFEIKEVELTGLYSHIFQHETDHLDGILMIDRMESEYKAWFLKEYRGKFKKH